MEGAPLDPENHEHRSLVQFLNDNPHMVHSIQRVIRSVQEADPEGSDLVSSAGRSTAAPGSGSAPAAQSSGSGSGSGSGCGSNSGSLRSSVDVLARGLHADAGAQAPSSEGQSQSVGEAPSSATDSQRGGDSRELTNSASSERSGDISDEPSEQVGVAESAPSEWQGDTAGMTTLLVQNVPPSYVQEDLLQLWPGDGTFDFLHLRPSHSASGPKKIAIINFPSPDSARSFHERWNGSTLPGGRSKKLAIAPAQVQGRDANLMLVLSTDVPILFHRGERLLSSEALDLVRLSKADIFFATL